jgi:transcriptional regulator of acetoin/glycerol metabolism
MLTQHQKDALTRLLESGAVTPQDVTEATGLSRQTVFRWFDASKAKEARRQLAAVAIVQALYPEQGARTRPLKSDIPAGIVAQRNPHKAAILKAIRAKSVTIPEAAKRAGVSIRAVLTWCKLANISLPTDYVNANTRNKSDT